MRSHGQATFRLFSNCKGGEIMALTNASLKARIVSELQAQGFVTEGEHVFTAQLAQAIANAVVAEIQASAEVPVTGGSSAGTYKVK